MSMTARWKEIARLRFKGPRFTDKALDAATLGEVQRYLQLVEETAKAVWKAEHPDREKLPAGFEERNRAYLRSVQHGSAVAVIEAKVEDSPQAEFLDREAETLLSAAELSHKVYDAVSRSRPLPDKLPKELVSAYADFGKSLNADEVVEIKAATRRRYVTHRAQDRERFLVFAQQAYNARLVVSGEVVEADVRQGRFQIRAEGKAPLPASFKPEQEEFITDSLKQHHSVRVRVVGQGEFSPEGKPLRFIEVTTLEIEPPQTLLFDPNALSIEQEMEAIWKDVPAIEWEKLPADLSDNLDHYLYGTPKR
jgi:hypothetical protein